MRERDRDRATVRVSECMCERDREEGGKAEEREGGKEGRREKQRHEDADAG